MDIKARQLHHRQRRFALLLAACSALPLAVSGYGLEQEAFATNYSFLSGTNWNNPSNWSPTGVPGAGDTAVITNNGSSNMSVQYDGNITFDSPLHSLSLGSAGGGSLTFNITNENLFTGGETIGAGVNVVQTGGINGGNAGNINLNGNYALEYGGSLYNTSLVMGSGGTGHLNVSNGGIASATTDMGLDGTVNVGGFGTGSLMASEIDLNGGSLNMYSGSTASAIKYVELFGGVLNLAGGTIQCEGLTYNTASELHWTSGTIDLIDATLGIGDGPSMQGTSAVGWSALTLGPGQNLIMSGTGGFGTVTIGTEASLVGGSLTASALSVDGPPFPGIFNWTSGTLNLTGTGVDIGPTYQNPFGSNYTLGTGQNLIVSGAGFGLNISSGCSLTIAGGSFSTGFSNVTSRSVVNDNGTLNISNGGRVSGVAQVLISSPTSAQVLGTGSLLSCSNLYLGLSSGGTMNISNGGQVSANAYVGYNGGQGTLSVSGIYALLQGSFLNVGYGSPTNTPSTGILKVASAAQINIANSIDIGTSGGSGTVTVDGTGSVMYTEGNLFIGQGTAGTAILSITGGGVAGSVANTYVGFNGGSGTVAVSGSGSALTGSGILFVGCGGTTNTSTGTLNLSNGGLVSGFNQIQIGLGSSCSGTVNASVPSATDLSINTLLIGTNGTYNQTGGATSAASISITGGVFSAASSNVSASTLFVSSGNLTVAGGASAAGITVGSGGLMFAGSAVPVITLSSGAGAEGVLYLNGDVSASMSSSTATIATSTTGSGQTPGKVDLGGIRTFNVDPGSASVQLLISAAVTDGGVVKTGDGTMALSNPANNFSGGVTVNGGTLQINAASSFTGGIQLLANGPSFGTLSVGSDGEFGASSNTITLAGGTLLAISTFPTSRLITLGDSNGNGNGTLSVTAGSTLTINSSIGGLAGLIKQGPGTLTLNGGLSYQGATQVMAGTLLLGPGVQLPGQSVIGVAPGATLDLGGQARSLAALQDISYNGGSGTISIGPAIMTEGSLPSSTTFSGNIIGGVGGAIVMSGAGSLTLAGPLTGFTGGTSVTQGTLMLTNPSNTFTGGVTANGGALQVANDGAMGNASNSITLSSGGTLETTATFSTNRNVTVSGGGGTIAIGVGDTLTSSGRISGSAPLTISGTTLIPGMTLGSGTLSLTSAQPFSGPLTIDGDTSSNAAAGITLLLSGSASLGSVSSITLKGEGTLEAEDATGLTSGRFDSATALDLDGGILEISGPVDGLADESLGVLSTSAFTSSTIDLLDGSGGGIDLSFASYSRGPGATLYFDMSPTDQIKFTGITTDESLADAWLTEMNPATNTPFTGHAYYDVVKGVEFTPGTGPAGTGGTGGTGAAVPEPGISILALVTTVGALRRRRREDLRFRPILRVIETGI